MWKGDGKWGIQRKRRARGDKSRRGATRKTLGCTKLQTIQTQEREPSPKSAVSGDTPNSNASKRPPRKSTLTQQQKNQKRQRATQDQLTTLEVEFNKNPTPTATVRERIADEINMTERSVQIWFQNRYVCRQISFGDIRVCIFLC